MANPLLKGFGPNGTTSLIVTHDAHHEPRGRIVQLERGDRSKWSSRSGYSCAGCQSPAIAAILPEEQEKIADSVLIGVHPNDAVRPDHLTARPGRVEIYEPGQVIVREGDPVNESSKFYLIRRGTVEVLREDGGAEKKLTEMGPGRYFGEVAFLMDRPRNATIRALTRVEVYTVDRATFDKFQSVSRPFIDRVLENFRASET